MVTRTVLFRPPPCLRVFFWLFGNRAGGLARKVNKLTNFQGRLLEIMGSALLQFALKGGHISSQLIARFLQKRATMAAAANGVWQVPWDASLKSNGLENGSKTHPFFSLGQKSSGLKRANRFFYSGPQQPSFLGLQNFQL